MSRRTTYLLCFIDPETGLPTRYAHAGHYIGDTEAGREAERLQEHREGRGAVLTAAARRAGLDFVITRTWPGGAAKARQLKSNPGTRYCPECTEHPHEGRARAGARYLTRRQRERAASEREAFSAAEAACRRDGGYGFVWPGQPVATCPGCERGGRGVHTSECDERERAAARVLAETGAEPSKESAMAEPHGPAAGPERDSKLGQLVELYPADPEDAGRFALPRVLAARDACPSLAPVAAALPDGTPHAAPYLAGRGWQAQGGVYVRREAERELEAG